MHSFRKIFTAALFLVFTGGILLIIDLPNRNVNNGLNFAKKNNSNVQNRDYQKNIDGALKEFNQPIKLALVHYAFSPDCEDVEIGILQRLNEIGYVRDTDFTLDSYNANADIGTLNNVVRVVADKKYDIIFSTVLVTAQALAAKIKDVPILFTVVADPIGNGLGVSCEEHIANVTGINGLSYSQRGIQLVKKYLPEVKRIGVLFPPGEAAALSELGALKEACNKHKIELIELPVLTVGEIADATELLCAKKVDAICQTPDNITIPGFASMVKISKKRGIPLFCFITSQVEMGAVAAIAGDFVQQGKEVANIAIRIINGTSTKDIPFSRINNIITVVNPEAATEYGLKTPDAVYKIAEKIVGKN